MRPIRGQGLYFQESDKRVKHSCLSQDAPPRAPPPPPASRVSIYFWSRLSHSHQIDKVPSKPLWFGLQESRFGTIGLLTDKWIMHVCLTFQTKDTERGALPRWRPEERICHYAPSQSPVCLNESVLSLKPHCHYLIGRPGPFVDGLLVGIMIWNRDIQNPKFCAHQNYLNVSQSS